MHQSMHAIECILAMNGDYCVLQNRKKDCIVDRVGNALRVFSWGRTEKACMWLVQLLLH